MTSIEAVYFTAMSCFTYHVRPRTAGDAADWMRSNNVAHTTAVDLQLIVHKAWRTDATESLNFRGE
jgi:hypothetical protein